ncbi:hypothetical protein [Porphyromonas macacae]|nr:hypothetical protein [Porphyromonas macacae]
MKKLKILLYGVLLLAVAAGIFALNATSAPSRFTRCLFVQL